MTPGRLTAELRPGAVSFHFGQALDHQMWSYMMKWKMWHMYPGCGFPTLTLLACVFDEEYRGLSHNPVQLQIEATVHCSVCLSQASLHEYQVLQHNVTHCISLIKFSCWIFLNRQTQNAQMHSDVGKNYTKHTNKSINYTHIHTISANIMQHPLSLLSL